MRLVLSGCINLLPVLDVLCDTFDIKPVTKKLNSLVGSRVSVYLSAWCVGVGDLTYLLCPMFSKGAYTLPFV